MSAVAHSFMTTCLLEVMLNVYSYKIYDASLNMEAGADVYARMLGLRAFTISLLVSAITRYNIHMNIQPIASTQ